MIFGESFEDIEMNPYKWATHIGKLEAIARGEDTYPVTVELDLVSYCNHNCQWCVDPQHTKHSLNREFISELLEELHKVGVEGIVLKGGGEATLHPEYAKILDDIHKQGFELGIVTNGSMLEKLYEPITKNANYVRISIDGPTHKTHRMIHNSDDFYSIVSGAKELVCERNKRAQRHPIVGISFAMDHSLLEQINVAINLGEKIGVDYVLFRPPFFEEVGRKNTMNVEQKKELFSAFERAKKAHQGNTKVHIDYWLSDVEAQHPCTHGESPRRGKYVCKGANGIEHITKRCLASPLMAVITADRNLYPCCNLRSLQEWSIGELNYPNGQTFNKLWKSTRRKALLERIHRIECIGSCTHPLSKYNEIIEYLRTPQHHRGFI